MRWHPRGVDIAVIRRERVVAIVEAKFDGSKAAFAKAIDRTDNYVSRMLNPNGAQHKKIGEDLARDIERKLQLPLGYLDGMTEAKAGTIHGIEVTPVGARLGAEWEKLEEPLRSQIQTLIETLVARQKRSRRKVRDDVGRETRVDELADASSAP